MEKPFPPSVCRGISPWPGWSSLPLPSVWVGARKICAGGGGRAKGLLPARSSNFFIYIYINATVLLWSIKDPLEIPSGGLP